MKIKSPRAVAGLALALLLALFGGVTAAGGGGGINDQPAEANEDGFVVAASAFEGRAVVLADLGGLDFDPTAAAAPATTAVATPVTQPAPPPTPTPTYTPGSVEALIESYFGPDTPKALSVARCESGLNPSAMSPGGGNHGLFQINNVHAPRFESVTGVPWSQRYDADANTRYAKWLFDRSGWGPWACA